MSIMVFWVNVRTKVSTLWRFPPTFGCVLHCPLGQLAVSAEPRGPLSYAPKWPAAADWPYCSVPIFYLTVILYETFHGRYENLRWEEGVGLCYSMCGPPVGICVTTSLEDLGLNQHCRWAAALTLALCPLSMWEVDPVPGTAMAAWRGT